MLLREKNQTVLIKTYTFESGLWYLAKSLGDQLIKEGHTVVYIPKSKYILTDRMYSRQYLIPKNPEEFKNNIILTFDKDKTVAKQVITAIAKYDADCLISFETLMIKSNWLYEIKQKTGIHIIDIPMIEWVIPNLLKNKSYNIFDEIWALNGLTLKYFKDARYKQIEEKTWNFVDNKLFYNQGKNNSDDLIFYHQASLNPEYSTKNTRQVLEAFSRFLENHDDVSLILTGKIDDKISLKIIEKHTNIEYINEALSRKEIANIYRYADCIIATSSREGLGLFLFEAPACGCSIITTNTPPMNEYNNKYLCKVEGYKKDKGLIPNAIINSKDVYAQITKFYKDNKDG